MNYQNSNSKIKVSYQTETHKIPLPDSLHILHTVITKIFLALPDHWELIYNNSNNQQVALHSEQDFQDLKANESHDPSKNLHIFIKERQNILGIKHDPFGISEFQVIAGESVEINLHQHVLNYIEKPNFISEKSETDLKKEVDNQQELDQKASLGLQNQVNELQKKLEDLADFRKVLGPKSIVSQLSKESVPLMKSEFVIASQIHPQKPSLIKHQPPQPQPQPQQRAAEGPVANLLISENTFEAMFQKMIKKNIGNIAAMTASILQNGGVQLQDQAVHEGTRCFECEVSPIIGIKYKCLVCPDYQVCKDCEAIHEHVHALMKIRHQNQRYMPLENEQEKQDEYSKPVSMVQSEYFEAADQDEEEKSSVSQKSREIIKKSEKVVPEPEVLEIIREESNIEEKQVVEEEQKAENIEEKEEEKPLEEKEEEKSLEIKEDVLLVSAEVRQVYSLEVIEKAKQLHQLLPEASLERLLEFVNSSPSKLDVVELMEKFQL